MLRGSVLLLWVLIVIVVIWLDVPRLLLPALLLATLAATAYRTQMEQKDPMAAERYRSRLVACCVVIAAISLPLILGMVPPNGVYGFRTSVTRSSTDIWYAANAFMGWALLAAAVTSAVALMRLRATAQRWLVLATFLVPILAAVAASLMYLKRFG